MDVLQLRQTLAPAAKGQGQEDGNKALKSEAKGSAHETTSGPQFSQRLQQSLRKETAPDSQKTQQAKAADRAPTDNGPRPASQATTKTPPSKVTTPKLSLANAVNTREPRTETPTETRAENRGELRPNPSQTQRPATNKTPSLTATKPQERPDADRLETPRTEMTEATRETKTNEEANDAGEMKRRDRTQNWENDLGLAQSPFAGLAVPAFAQFQTTEEERLTELPVLNTSNIGSAPQTPFSAWTPSPSPLQSPLPFDPQLIRTTPNPAPHSDNPLLSTGFQSAIMPLSANAFVDALDDRMAPVMPGSQGWTPAALQGASRESPLNPALLQGATPTPISASASAYASIARALPLADEMASLGARFDDFHFETFAAGPHRMIDALESSNTRTPAAGFTDDVNSKFWTLVSQNEGTPSVPTGASQRGMALDLRGQEKPTPTALGGTEALRWGESAPLLSTTAVPQLETLGQLSGLSKQDFALSSSLPPSPLMGQTPEAFGNNLVPPKDALLSQGGLGQQASLGTLSALSERTETMSSQPSLNVANMANIGAESSSQAPRLAPVAGSTTPAVTLNPQQSASVPGLSPTSVLTENGGLKGLPNSDAQRLESESLSELSSSAGESAGDGLLARTAEGTGVGAGSGPSSGASATPSSTTQSTDRIATSVAARAMDAANRMVLQGQQGQARMTIRDSSIGSVDVIVSVNGRNSVTIDLQTNSSELKKKLEGQLDEMKDKLHGQKFQNVDIKVVADTQLNSGFESNQGRNQSRENTQSSASNDQRPTGQQSDNDTGGRQQDQSGRQSFAGFDNSSGRGRNGSNQGSQQGPNGIGNRIPDATGRSNGVGRYSGASGQSINAKGNLNFRA